MSHAGAFCFVFWADLDAPFIADAHLVSDVAPVKMAFAEKNLRNLVFLVLPSRSRYRSTAPAKQTIQYP